MDWCERCGKWFVRRTGRATTHGVSGRGMFSEPGVGVCGDCLRYGEWVDEVGMVRTGPKDTYDAE